MKYRTGNRTAYIAAGMVLIIVLSVFVFPERSSAATKYKYSIIIGKYGSGTVVPKGSKLKLACKGNKKKNGKSSRTTLVYRSSDKRIATVSSKGIVRGKKKGKVRITIYCKANRRIRSA